MPCGDQTGPLGAGAGTGSGRGYCGLGNKLGRSSHFRKRFIQQKPSLDILEQEEKILEEELSAIREEKKNLKEAK
jgi:hypothetical protein